MRIKGSRLPGPLETTYGHNFNWPPQSVTTLPVHSLPPKWTTFSPPPRVVRVSLRIHMCPYTPRPIETRRVGLPDACMAPRRIFVTRNSVCRRQLIRLR